MNPIVYSLYLSFFYPKTKFKAIKNHEVQNLILYQPQAYPSLLFLSHYPPSKIKLFILPAIHLRNPGRGRVKWISSVIANPHNIHWKTPNFSSKKSTNLHSKPIQERNATTSEWSNNKQFSPTCLLILDFESIY